MADNNKQKESQTNGGDEPRLPAPATDTHIAQLVQSINKLQYSNQLSSQSVLITQLQRDKHTQVSVSHIQERLNNLKVIGLPCPYYSDGQNKDAGFITKVLDI